MTSPDPAKAAEILARAHPEVRRARERHGPPFTGGRPRPADHFTLLVRSIVGQQISVAAAEAILDRTVALLPEKKVTPAGIGETDPDMMRSAGLSRAKVRTLHALADACSDGRIDLAGADERGEDAVRAELCAIPGIGPWTADMFLMFGLRCPDIWPIGDVAMRRGYASLAGLAEIPDAKAILPMGDAYRPFRSVLAWYCWAEIDADPQGSAWN